MDKLRLIQVPNNSKNHWINNIGCLRFDLNKSTGTLSSVIEPNESGIYLETNKHEIVG